MKAVIYWLVIFVSAFLLWQVVRTGSSAPREPEISYSEFLTRVANGQVSKVTIAGSQVHGRDVKGSAFRVIAPANQSAMLEMLQQRGVEIWFREQADHTWPAWMLNLAPLILLAALWLFMIRRMQRKSRPSGPGAPISPDSQASQGRFG